MFDHCVDYVDEDVDEEGLLIVSSDRFVYLGEVQVTAERTCLLFATRLSVIFI